MSWQCHCKESQEAGWDWSGNNSSKSYLLWYVQLVYDYVFFRKYHRSYLWWQMDGQQSIAASTHLSPSSTSMSCLIHLNYGTSRATSSTSSILLGITQGSEWMKNLLKSSQNLGCRKRWVCSTWSYSLSSDWCMYLAGLDNWQQCYCQQSRCLLCLQHPWS